MNLLYKISMVIALVLVSQNAISGKKYALVIGNSNYKFGLLKNPLNDANDFAKTLLKNDFEVTVLTNATLDETNKSIEIFLENIRSPNSVGLIFYAGHGVQFNNENYLLPLDVSVDSVLDIKLSSLSLSETIRKLRQVKNKLNLVILDSCRNNPFKPKSSSPLDIVAAYRGIAGETQLIDGVAPVVLDTSSGIVIWYSTRPGKVALDGKGRNSPFTENLIRKININKDKPARIMISEVALSMQNENIGQQPWQEGIWLNDFYFNKEIKNNLNKVVPEDIDKEIKEFDYLVVGLHPNSKEELNSNNYLGKWQCTWHDNLNNFFKGTAEVTYYKFEDGMLYGKSNNSYCPGETDLIIDTTKRPFEFTYKQPEPCGKATFRGTHFRTNLGQLIWKSTYEYSMNGYHGSGTNICVKVY